MLRANFLTQLRFNSLPTYSAKKSSRLILHASANRNILPSNPISNWSRWVNFDIISAILSSLRRIFPTYSNNSRRNLLYFFSNTSSGLDETSKLSKRFACNFCIDEKIRLILLNNSVIIGISASSITGIETPEELRCSPSLSSGSSSSSSSSSSPETESSNASKSSSFKSSTWSTPLDFNVSFNAANDFCSDSLEYITSKLMI